MRKSPAHTHPRETRVTIVSWPGIWRNVIVAEGDGRINQRGKATGPDQ